jgi:hypothetical protein
MTHDKHNKTTCLFSCARFARVAHTPRALCCSWTPARTRCFAVARACIRHIVLDGQPAAMGMDIESFARVELERLETKRLREMQIQAARRIVDLERATYVQPERDAPPWVSYTGPKTVMRSASHDQFQHPPSSSIRRREPCMPQPRLQFQDKDFPLPLTTHKAHFSDRGLPKQLPNCRPKHLINDDTLGSVKTLARTTSADAFLSKPLSTRQLCRPPSSSGFFSGDNWIFNQGGTTNSAHFKFMIRPSMRESCRPATTSALPFLTANETGGRLARSTSRDAFQAHDVRIFTRQSCKPTDTSQRPY